jgi:hypothetical protein
MFLPVAPRTWFSSHDDGFVLRGLIAWQECPALLRLKSPGARDSEFNYIPATLISTKDFILHIVKVK